MERRPSVASSHSKNSYPSFSRAHSKEVIGSRDDLVNPLLSLYTPDPTILDSEARPGKNATRTSSGAAFGGAPPSPPLTAKDPELDLRRSKSGHSISVTRKPSKTPVKSRPSSMDGVTLPSLGSRSTTSKSTKLASKPEPRVERSKPIIQVVDNEYDDNSDVYIVSDSDSSSDGPATARQSTLTADSQATPLPHRPFSRPAISKARASPQTVSDPSPRTPPSVQAFPNISNHPKQIPGIDIVTPNRPYSVQSNYSHVAPPSQNAAPPPPPPPPAPGVVETPRVDYLLQNGGLAHAVPRSLFGGSTTSTSTPNGPLDLGSIIRSREGQGKAAFAPYHKLLDDYLQVISRNGSIAVATGYRSVARRLLDRLETVFNRNISSENCECIVCSRNSQTPTTNDLEETGLSWGELLEYVSGRKDLPAWPPFIMSQDKGSQNLAVAAEAPMQKLDIDVPEEYREHYIRQSKKTKQVVQAWLHSQPSLPSSPPQEVDDETLLFAIFTSLEPERRQLFTALLRDMPTLPMSRAPTPRLPDKIRPELIVRTSVALQRLYRLRSSPRDPESALYLLNNPHLHSVLATLAAISSHEWDVLVSGRFDGFLWSGAAPMAASMSSISLPPSRHSTPFETEAGINRGPTPSPGAPVQLDEDTEIQVLAEVEREIFAGMDALEDAFEALHVKAETVRAALRTRAGGLSMSASQRRGDLEMGPEIRSTPTPNPWAPSNSHGMWDGLMDDGFDLRSELAPDDSASNISATKRRRKRGERKELRTPMTVEEEDD